VDLEKVVALVKAGTSPLSLSLKHRVPHSTIVDTIQVAVDHGVISKSEVLYAIDTRVRSAVDDAIRHGVSTVEDFKRDLRASIRYNSARAAGGTLAVESFYTENEDVPEVISETRLFQKPTSPSAGWNCFCMTTSAEP